MNTKNWRICPRCGGRLKKDLSQELAECQKCRSKFYSQSVPGAAAIITDIQGRVILGKRTIDPGRGKWSLPGGFLKKGEHPVDGLKREIKEELKAEIQVERFFDFEISQSPYDPEKDILSIYFLAKLKSAYRANDETSEAKFFAQEEIPWSDIAGKDDKKILEKFFKTNN